MISKAPQENQYEIDFKELFLIIFLGKWIILALTTLFSILALLYSLQLPDIYDSKALLVPVAADERISGNISAYGGLTSLSGFRLNPSSSSSTAKAIEKIKSLSFFENSILPNIDLPQLMAFKSWNKDTNSILYNDKVFNSQTNTWNKTASSPKSMPSSQESYDKFKNHLSISKDDKTGFITLNISHQSPYIAKAWVELVVDQINLYFRAEDKLISQKSLDYLNAEISKTNFTEIKLVLAELLQKEIQKLTLIEANESYVFKYIDPPVAMEKKTTPFRALICIVGSLLGFIAGIIFVLIRHTIFYTNESAVNSN